MKNNLPHDALRAAVARGVAAHGAVVGVAGRNWVARHEPTGIERGFATCAAAEAWVEGHEDGDEYIVKEAFEEA